MTHLDINAVPGTVQLIDEDGKVRTKHSGDNSSDIILIPTPSDDPEDPLNWSHRRKLLSTSCVVMYTFMACLPSTAVYSVTTSISENTELETKDLITGLGIMFLFAGWGCIPWQAFALQYGKRPVYLASLVGHITVMGLAPRCRTWPTYLANKILHGFFTAPVESLCEISITDIWFAHQRPKYLTIYGFALSFAGKLAPTLAGLINVGQGWEWTLYWCAIWLAIAFVYCFFLMEETTYDRVRVPPLSSRVVNMYASSSSYDTDIATGQSMRANPEKGKSKSQQEDSRQVMADVEVGQVSPDKTTTGGYWHKLSIWPQSRPNRLLSVMWAPMRYFMFPNVVYAGLMYGANGLVWSGILNATSGTLYKEVYGFSTAGIAAAYVAGVVGVIFGAIYCGKLGEILVIRLAKRNGGISEPEHILWILVASLILVPFSLLLWGMGAFYHFHWFGMVFAQFSLAISNTISCPMALAYAISSYPEMGSEMVTTVVIIRNTLSFAFNYAISPWLEAQGLRDTFITAAAIGLVWNASLFPMIKWGKALRKQSASRYWKRVEQMRHEGQIH